MCEAYLLLLRVPQVVHRVVLTPALEVLAHAVIQPTTSGNAAHESEAFEPTESSKRRSEAILVNTILQGVPSYLVHESGGLLDVCVEAVLEHHHLRVLADVLHTPYTAPHHGKPTNQSPEEMEGDA